MLSAYYEYCRTEYEVARILPVYVDCTDLELGPVLPRVSVDDLISRFYKRCIFKIRDTLREFADSTITPGILKKLFHDNQAVRRKRINKSLQELDKLLDIQIEERVKEYIRQQEIDHASVGELAGSIGISPKFTAAGPALGVAAGARISADDVKRERDKVTLVFKGLEVIDHAAIRRALESVIENCGAQGIVVLMDEWSSIDLTIQPVLAEMLRRTLTISSKISVKVVGLKYWTQTSATISPPQRIGLQVGSDISILADVDLYSVMTRILN